MLEVIEMIKQKLVIVGNGMAGVRCVEEILKHDPNMYSISIIGSESHGNYNRILLSTVLQGDTSFEDITINERDWYSEHGIELYIGETAIDIDKQRNILITDKNREVPYDKLILATGSNSFVLPIPGADKNGVIAFRTIEDCKKMIQTAKQYKKSVVIGGGLLGLEAARGLLNLGMDVSVVHLSNYLMDRQLDPTASKMLQKELEEQGINFLLEKQTEKIIGGDRVEGLRFNDGIEIETDLIVMAAGVRPNIQLAQASRIKTNRGIVVNDFMETSIPNIFAVGECAEHRGAVYGLVKPLYEQGKVLASHLCGIDSPGYYGSVLSTQLKISGVNVFSAGKFDGDESTNAITVNDERARVYKKIVFKENKLIGAVLYGDTKDGSRLLELIVKDKDIADFEKVVLLHSDKETQSSISSMVHSDMICTCNGVTKGTIIEVVQKEGLTTVDQVKKCTKASGSCGGCKPLVAELLAYIQSDDFDEVIEQKTMCSCTSLTEEEVVHQMQLKALSSAQQVMENLRWKNKDGCSTCLPALNYYLGMIYPEYESSQEIIFISEYMNATSEKDGTYSVVPQMYGGMTSGEQLRTIADVIDKYGIAKVAITSEQRIHLMGVKKEDLNGLWMDLNMRLNSTYGNTVNNVKTCIGEHICQCEKQLSLNLSVELDKKIEFLTTPYRVKIGVSACLHNGAGSTTKDIGVIGINRGWEIHVGGSSGRNARSGELLCVAETAEETIEIIAGVIQYYRETANFLERTWQWIDRIGLIHLREVLFEKELLSQLLKRLEIDTMHQRKRSKNLNGKNDTIVV